MIRLSNVVALLVVVSAQSAFAGEPPWTVISTGPISIKSRPLPGHPTIREVWAEADLKASVQDMEGALMEVSQYTSFMPYVSDAWEIPPRDPDGTRYVYTRLALPVVSARDYVLHVTLDKSTQDGDIFENHWTAASNKMAERKGTVRLAVNQGSWVITPKGEFASHAVYKFAVDPGGWIPPFVADIGNKGAVEDTVRGVEKEGIRRGNLRRAASAVAQQPKVLESARP